MNSEVYKTNLRVLNKTVSCRIIKNKGKCSFSRPKRSQLQTKLINGFSRLRIYFLQEIINTSVHQHGLLPTLHGYLLEDAYRIRIGYGYVSDTRRIRIRGVSDFFYFREIRIRVLIRIGLVDTAYQLSWIRPSPTRSRISPSP